MRTPLIAGGLMLATASAAVALALATHGNRVASTSLPSRSPSPSATPAATGTSATPPAPTEASSAPPARTATSSPRSAATSSRGPAHTPPPSGSLGPATSLHYTANGNWVGNTYVPGPAGFNLADISDPSLLSELPANTRALVYVGQCDGTGKGSAFLNAVQGFQSNPRLYGFYLMDEPHPSACPAVTLEAESDWLHANIPGAKTFVVLENQSETASPTYQNTYNPANTHIDLYGLDPYPCRADPGLNGCNDTWIALAVHAAESAGVPLADVVPVYQTFGGGSWADDGGGQYLLPTATQETQLLADWAHAVPSPPFDYAYSWGAQNGDTALGQSPDLQAVLRTHNGR